MNSADTDKQSTSLSVEPSGVDPLSPGGSVVWGQCWKCGSVMIQGGDHDYDEDSEEHLIVSNFTCPECGSYALFYWS